MSQDLLDRLADSDPARGLDLPAAEDRHELRESILATPRTTRSPERTRWRPRAGLAGAAVSLLVIALVAGVLIADLGAPAVVATPELRVPVDAPTEPADELLRDLADAAETSGDESTPGRRSVGWSLSTAVTDIHTACAGTWPSPL